MWGAHAVDRKKDCGAGACLPAAVLCGLRLQRAGDSTCGSASFCPHGHCPASAPWPDPESQGKVEKFLTGSPQGCLSPVPIAPFHSPLQQLCCSPHRAGVSREGEES